MEVRLDVTVAEEFSRRLRRRAVLEKCLYASTWLSLFVMWLCIGKSNYPLWPSITILVVILAAMTWGKFDWRCPSCRGFLPKKGELLEECPHCHASFVNNKNLDSEVARSSEPRG